MKVIQYSEVEMTAKKSLFVTAVLLAAYVLSACGNAPMPSSTAPGAAKVDASIVAYVGAIEGMDGNQWIVGGQTLAVDPAMVRDGPFQVGDVVKVEATVNPDGSLTVSRIEAPSADDLTTLPPAADNANVNSNDANGNTNINDDANVNSNDDNDDNDDNGNANGNDDDSDDDDNGNANGNANSNDNDSGDKVNGGSHDGGSDDDDGDEESDDD
jgi:hypothetical protein